MPPTWQDFLQELIEIDPSVAENTELLEKAKVYFTEKFSVQPSLYVGRQPRADSTEKSIYASLMKVLEGKDFKFEDLPGFIKPKPIPDEVYSGEISTKSDELPPKKPWMN
jgi:hypothetical protein